ncbi:MULTISPECIES: ABC transporter [Terribacillus]|uniref:ABC transporter n=1 Tax=Terribacillus TaxID=459532 RepID=UPI000BA53011|nr:MULTISPECIES: ABC transporter [Terribacillus]
MIKIFANWETKLEKNEWYFSDCYEELTTNLSSFEAFSAIPDVISVLLTVKDPFLLNETIDFLDTLYIIADTTEIHPMLRGEWENIKSHIQRFGDNHSYVAWKGLTHMLRISEMP